MSTVCPLKVGAMDNTHWGSYCKAASLGYKIMDEAFITELQLVKWIVNYG